MKRFTVLVVFLLVGVFALSAAPTYKIGLVFDLAGRGDNSFNDSAYQGLVAIAKTFKGYIDGDPDNVNYGSNVQIKYLEPKAGGQDREILMRNLAEDGYQLIYGVGFAFADALGKVAKDFPDVHFCIIDSYVDLPNVTGLEFKENEGSFLVGAIAGLMNKGQKVGFLGGVDIPLIHRFDNGYVAGAMYINPALRKSGMVVSQYISKDFSGFADPTGGYNVASNLYKQGCSIVFHAAGASGDGLFKAAEEAKKYAIGVDSDQGLIYASDKQPATQARAKWILTSMMKRVDNAVLAAGTEFIKGNGSMSSGEHRFGLKEDGVGFADNKYNHALLAPYLTRINNLKKDIIAGKIVVPDENTDMTAWAKTLK